MTVILESKDRYAELRGDIDPKFSAEAIEAMRAYWRAGDRPSYIATKFRTTSCTVVRYCRDLAPQRPRQNLSQAKTSHLLQGWYVGR